jgi:4'-phosphopantetheinyl transferase EntD
VTESAGGRYTNEANVATGILPELPLASLFTCEVAVAYAAPAIVDDRLYADEREYVAESVARRRAEFGTARVCARAALAELGFAPCSLAPHPDRSPRWPLGAVGSISHTEGVCAVAAALSSRAAGLGLDLEGDGPLGSDLESVICTPTERRWLDRWSGERRGQMAKLVFSAKEAFYKCQHSTTRSYLDFLDVDLHIDPAAGTFEVARVHRSGAGWRFVEKAKGRLLRTAGLVLAGATL